MPRSTTYRTEAVILRRHDFGETDRILTLYTPSHGKLRAIAKGVRRITSRRSGHIELLTRAKVLLARGRELDVLTQAEALESFRTLREDLYLTACGYYVAELVDRVVADRIENPRLYGLLVSTLERLATEQRPEVALRHFELHLVRLIGYEPVLSRCVLCSTALEPRFHKFAPEEGGTVCDRCAVGMTRALSLSLNCLKALRWLAQDNYTEVIRLRMGPDLSGEVTRILHSYLRYVVEDEIRSASFIDLVKALSTAKPDAGDVSA